jgi:adenosylmethionine-8-amino-7-oxononanoate aminotransferase
VGDIRGLGLLWAVEFVADRQSKQPYPAEKGFSARVAQACAKRGVLVYPMQGSVDGISGDHILVAPPAVITQSQIEWSTEQVGEAIREAQQSE